MESVLFRLSADANRGELDETVSDAGLTLDEVHAALTQAMPWFEKDDIFIEHSSAPTVTVCESQRRSLSFFVKNKSAVDTAAMHKLRDSVLSGDLDVAMANTLAPEVGVTLHADRSEFAELFEERMLHVNELTPHQREKVQECAEHAIEDLSHGGIHLRAPAGAGKTFVALQRVLDTLRDDTGKAILFVARNEALAYFAAAWVGRRAAPSERTELLSRLNLLYHPFNEGPRYVVVTPTRVCLEPYSGKKSACITHPDYALVVVDEAHHLYASPEAVQLIEGYVKAGLTQRLLMSDISQSRGHEAVYPQGMQLVELSEVVRCSKRIVAGAMAFQLGGEEKLLTKCHHEATGPPLKSFLFDLPNGPERKTGFFQTYARHVVLAIKHVLSVFTGLNLHNRLAFVVPNDEFREGLRPELELALVDQYPKRHFKLIDATTASSIICRESRCMDDATADSESNADNDDSQTSSEWLVYDSMSQVDGLERLIVVCIGLDTVISDTNLYSTSELSASNSLESRSMLYRGVTRSHLMAIVVNEFLRGGFLEFLGSVRLEATETFDSKKELRRSEAQAVEGVIKDELTSKVAAAAERMGVRIQEEALAALASDLAKLCEAGRSGSEEAAVEEVLRVWKSESQQVRSSFVTASQQMSVPLTETVLEALIARLTLALHQHQVVNLAVAVRDALREQESRVCELLCRKALQSAAASLRDDGDAGFELGSEALAALQPRVASLAADRGITMEQAAKEIAAEWLQVEQHIGDAVQEHCACREPLIREGDYSRMRQAVTAAVWRGEPIDESVDRAWEKMQHDKLQADITAALETAIARSSESALIIHAGSSVSLVALQKSPELNGQRGVAEAFLASRSRWSVRLEQGSRTVMALKPDNLQVLGSQLAIERSPSLVSPQQISLRNAVATAAAATSVDAESLQAIAVEKVHEWRVLEAQVASSLQEAAGTRQVHLSPDLIGSLVLEVLGEVQGFCDGSGGTDVEAEAKAEVGNLHDIVEMVIETWSRRERTKQEETAQISAAIQSAATSKRILLTAAATSTLQQKVATALQRGLSLEAAVRAAVEDWQRQVVRKQVQQNIWDPTGNSSKMVTGVVRFMPFKLADASKFDVFLLSEIFPYLPFNALGTLARVCKRWQNAASDPSWKPELVAYVWGAADVTGLSRACPRPTLLELSVGLRIVNLACSDNATFVVSEQGNVWWWGKSWLTEIEPNCPEPTRIPELEDIVAITTTPAGYFHGRERRRGYSCAALRRDGGLYTWGQNEFGHLLHTESEVARPRRVYRVARGDNWDPATERVLHVACGLYFMAVCVCKSATQTETGGTAAQTTAVLTAGCFCFEQQWQLKEFEELRGAQLRQLVAGGFHCCAVTTGGEVYTFGDEIGRDHANGNLLGHGEGLGGTQRPRRLETPGLGPVAEVSCSSYSNLAITVDGRAFTWGDCDGDALGHQRRSCHTPEWLRALRLQRVAHGACAYTNAAVATHEGRVFVWGGNQWEGGIAAGRGARGPSEVQWAGVPSCYKCSSVALAHRHGFLIFRREP